MPDPPPPETHTIARDAPMGREEMAALARQGWFVGGASKRGDRNAAGSWIYSLSRRPPPGGPEGSGEH